MKILRNKTYLELLERIKHLESNYNFYKGLYEQNYKFSLDLIVQIINNFNELLLINQEELLLNLEHQGWI